MEVLVTLTAAGYLLGRRELPKLSKFVGLYCGRSVGAILRAKQEFFDATKDNEIVKLQQEFQRGINELNEIRAELTSVGNLSRPHQPVGTAPSPESRQSVVPTAAAAAAAAHASGSYAARPVPSEASESSTKPSVAFSLSMASADYAAVGAPRTLDSDHANLAMAEIKLAQQGKYSTRIESLEGGADYVSASIVDSLLLERKK
ncbi:TPA: hypothetical protein N0F65_000673 [Lagenidium giganteum]|uniref:Peroxin-14 n=1 Tax=Lagenidium giganteum TaxID=4803 RepID=A0AAV2Z0U4_9STRA|nr:TPA: hypothetical protein N0F65_000673 [Lagenidium giganteum]